MVWRIAGLVILGMLGAGAALAQPADDAATCLDFRGPIEPQIAACTRLIDAGNGTPAELARYHVERGWAVDDDAAAIADFTAAIALDPQNAEAFAARAYFAEEEERWDDAVADYAAAAAIEPDYAFRHYDLATAYYYQARAAEAVAVLDTALTVNPDYQPALYLRGWIHAIERRNELALPDFAHLVELAPLRATAQESLGTVHYRMGNTEEAIRALAAAILLDPNLGDARFALEELTPPRMAEAAGPLVYREPPEGMRITFIEVIGETPPVIDPMEEAIRGLIGFFTAETNYPTPDIRRSAARDFGATTERSTEVTATLLAGGEDAPVTLPHLYGLWPTAFPPGGPPVTIAYDEGLAAFWKMAPGDSVDVAGDALFACPAQTNPIGIMLGCTAGVTAAVVGGTRFTATFDGWEYVVVPAGQRLAAKVRFAETRSLTLAGQSIENAVVGVWWLDPELGFWIRREQSQDGLTQTIAAFTIELP
ncbi:MAG: tetratricopeptide repeat protein [Bauldia sp.]|nr:tetratricopeptide repeat protein [Bauldia sp.]